MISSRHHLLRALCCCLAALACATPSIVVAQSNNGTRLDPLLAEAESAVEGATLSARWEKLRHTPGYLRALAKAELMRVTGEANVRAVASRPGGADFLKAFLADPEWIETYLASGPVPENTADGLDTLRKIWQADREADAPKYRRLATAVALVFNTEVMRARLREVTTRDVNPLTPVARYQFYKASHKAGRLRPSFGRLAVWELRWVVCAPVENEALAWLQQKVNVPLDEFDATFSVPRYRGVNDFGNSVQGPLFSAPSRSQYNWAEDVARNGGVCGALSTFGALNAIARGVPATPVGQPGHCAYAYRAAPGKWIPGFGGGDGGAHYTFWASPFSYVWLADDAFSASDRMLESMRLAWCARRAAVQGSDEALDWFELATAAHPLNWPVWEETIAAAAAKSTFGPADWRRLAEKLTAGMARHPQPMCDLLAKFEGKHLWPTMNQQEKLTWFRKIHDTIAAHQHSGWTPWDMTREVLTRQLKEFGDEAPPNAVFGPALSAYVRYGHEFFIGKLIDWGTQNLAKSPEGSDRFFEAMNSALSVGGTATDDKVRKKILFDAIRATEEARSIAGFQALSEAAAKFAVKEGTISPGTRPAGKLVSDGGLIYLSGSDGYDNPASHRGVITEEGGFFHGQPAKDDKDKRRWVVVQLPETHLLTSLWIVNRPSNQGRCKALRIEVSTDERTWKTVAENHEFKQEWQLDLQGQNVRARWVRVENLTSGSDVFHLRNICVYGEVEQ